jgi:dihydroorotase
MDPESGLDDVRSIGIRAGRIAAISPLKLRGHDVIDVANLVVAPGFIDLHSHSIGIDGDKWQVRDGVSTALELEEGAFPVSEWYASQAGKSLINFGTSAGHIPARIAVMQGVGTLAEARALRMGDNPDPEPPWSHQAATGALLDRIEATVRDGIEAGGLGIGLAINESPAASRLEILRMFELAKQMGVPIYAHLRSSSWVQVRGIKSTAVFTGADPIAGSLAGAQEVLADAAVSGASLQFVHLASSSGIYARDLVAMIEGSRARGLDITAEVYPYTASSTDIDSPFFDGEWQKQLGISYGALEWPETGERLTQATFPGYRARGGLVIIHWLEEADVEFVIARPGVMIASDAMPFTLSGRGHPRGAGAFARLLGRYVRERHTLSLMEALRKVTLLPAERVRGAAPMMARKGRIQVGADADLTVFDPKTVIDRATFGDPQQPSAGIPYVIVNGTVVVREGNLIAGVAPGQPVRRGQL